MAAGKKIRAWFFRQVNGSEPVREWLKKEATVADRKRIGEDIMTVEFTWPVGMPLVRGLGRGLWEVRSDLAGGRAARVFFAVHDGFMILLHAFVKKSQKTPQADLSLARSRLESYKAAAKTKGTEKKKKKRK